MMSDQAPETNTAAAPQAREPDELVTVAFYPDPATAQVARTALESAGIGVFLQGENANSLLPVAFLARLQVRRQDELAARELLTASDLNPESMEDVTAAEMASEGEVE